MKDASAAAFDRAITDVLLRRVDGDGKRYEQLRREVAFERVLARLVAEDPDMWLLKGGVALDYRLHEARSPWSVVKMHLRIALVHRYGDRCNCQRRL